MFIIKYPLRSASRKASLAVSQIGEKETNLQKMLYAEGWLHVITTHSQENQLIQEKNTKSSSFYRLEDASFPQAVQVRMLAFPTLHM